MLKNKLFLYLCTIACIFALNANIFAANKTIEQHWYLKYRSEGIQPDTPDNGAYAKQYGTITLDKSGEKTVYLTFDAGYENGNVKKTLDILKAHDVPGAFFVLPNLMRTNPELLRRMNDEGHLICNHTRSHKNMAKIHDIKLFEKELSENEQILKDELGLIMSKFYRPPEGSFSEENLEYAKQLGYKTVFWSLAHADWDNDNQPAPEKALTLLKSRMHPGCVLLLHPTSKTNAEILDALISSLKNQGYVFKSLEEFPD